MHREVHIIVFKQQVYACGSMCFLWVDLASCETKQDAEEHMQLIKIPLPQFYQFKLQACPILFLRRGDKTFDGPSPNTENQVHYLHRCTSDE
jgi:hypothetical protein